MGRLSIVGVAATVLVMAFWLVGCVTTYRMRNSDPAFSIRERAVMTLEQRNTMMRIVTNAEVVIESFDSMKIDDRTREAVSSMKQDIAALKLPDPRIDYYQRDTGIVG